MEAVKIGKRQVGDGFPPYVIAEIGSNHNGDMNLCRKLVDTAKACGADAVKFQSWSRNSLISRAEYARNTSYSDKKRHFGSLEEMVERYQFTPEQHREMSGHCREKGIEFLSSCFAPEEVDLLESLGVPAHKIASMDVNHLPLLRYVARTGKPIVLSTGMASLAEVATAVDTLRQNGARQIILLHCVSIYPPDVEDIHLRNIPMLRETFDVPVGFSDHTLGATIALAAVALGACIVEKHFTLDKNMDGWDHWISADPPELRTIVQEAKTVFASLGSRARTVSPAEMEKRRKFRRRIVARVALPKGHRLAEADINFKRPGTGVHPNELKYVTGRVLLRDVEADHELEWSDMG